MIASAPTGVKPGDAGPPDGPTRVAVERPFRAGLQEGLLVTRGEEC